MKMYIKLDKYNMIIFKLADLVRGCKKHPSYRYHRKPITNCKKCKNLYDTRIGIINYND